MGCNKMYGGVFRRELSGKWFHRLSSGEIKLHDIPEKGGFPEYSRGSSLPGTFTLLPRALASYHISSLSTTSFYNYNKFSYKNLENNK